MTATETTDWTDLDAFTTAYLECGLWASHAWIEDQEPSPLDDHIGIEDLSQETLREAISDCDGFRELVKWESLSPYTGNAITDDERGGHDFFLTREGHGAGFWDGRVAEPLATTLTDAAKTFGTHDWHGCDMIAKGAEGSE